MNIPDELLAAYVSGELQGAERARIEQAIQYDARLAQRVAQQRARRARAPSALDEARQESVRLVQPIRSAAATGSAQVIDLARVRAERKRRSERARGVLSRRLALVAGIAGGLLIGVVIDRLAPDGALTQYRDGALFAHGALADALNEQLTLSPVAGNTVHVGMSFRAKRGNYCRTFSVRDTHALAGLACREKDQWRVWTLVASEARSGRTVGSVGTSAAGLPAAVVQAVDERISGSPLDAQSELSARRSGWR
jgi:hypothetical protein